MISAEASSVVDDGVVESSTVGAPSEDQTLAYSFEARIALTRCRCLSARLSAMKASTSACVWLRRRR